MRASLFLCVRDHTVRKAHPTVCAHDKRSQDEIGKMGNFSRRFRVDLLVLCRRAGIRTELQSRDGYSGGASGAFRSSARHIIR